MANIAEINHLLTLVEQKFGRTLSTTTDFEALSATIETETGDILSTSTLKRLYGYVSLRCKPRISTLDILSRYIGKLSFAEFHKSIKDELFSSSKFFSAKTIYASNLHIGDRVRIGWAPNRIVILEHIGEGLFKVTESDNSKLQPGDIFHQNCFMLNVPLVISHIQRGDEGATPFIAGIGNGLNLVELV